MHDHTPIADGDHVPLDATQRPPSAADETPAGFVLLRLILQPNGLILELDRPDITLGRHSEADLRLPLPDVSRRHCRFTWADGQWQVRDLSSLNGIYVNGLQVRQASLAQNDLVRIGGFTFAVDLHHPAPPCVKAPSEGRIHSIVRSLPQALQLPGVRRLAS